MLYNGYMNTNKAQEQETDNLQTETIQVEGHIFHSEVVTTENGEALKIKLDSHDTERFRMTLKYGDLVIADTVGTGMTIFNGEISIDIDGHTVSRSHMQKVPHQTATTGFETGVYIAHTRSRRYSREERLRFDLGELSVSPNEEGVLASKAGLSVRGMSGNSVTFSYKGELVGESADLSVFTSRIGLAEVADGENSLIICNR